MRIENAKASVAVKDICASRSPSWWLFVKGWKHPLPFGDRVSFLLGWPSEPTRSNVTHQVTTQIFVNLPVKDLDKSVAFFKAVGFKNNPKFTDKTAACIVFSDDINAMLLTHDKFESFAKKPLADAQKTTEVLTCPTFDDKDKVDEIVDKAIAAGGSEPERKAAGKRFDVHPHL
jgi:predicted lactoylglutathione lyase